MIMLHVLNVIIKILIIFSKTLFDMNQCRRYLKTLHGNEPSTEYRDGSCQRYVCTFGIWVLLKELTICTLMKYNGEMVSEQID